jgi:aspartate aminotransferase
MHVSKRTQGLGTETAFEVLAEVNKLKAQGQEVISFCIGQPDFDTPEHIKKGAKKAMDEGKTGYTSSDGILKAREAVARYLSRTRKIEVKPDYVVMANGAKQFIKYAIACTTDPGVGDEVIYPNPGYPVYLSQASALGAVPVPLPLVEKRGFCFEIEALKQRISAKTKLLILNSPQNPTGGMLSEDDLKEIANLAKKHDFWIFSDEVYSQIVYEDEFRSIASIGDMYERTIICDGLSKSYAMPGWRMGFAANPTLAPHISRWVTNIEGCANHMTQHALISALDGPHDETQKMVKSFRERRDIIVDGLNELDGVNCHKPKGAFYAYANVSKAMQKLDLKTSVQLQRLLLKNGVAVLADTHFGRRNFDETQHYIRLSYATSKENILKGLEIMARVLGKKEPVREQEGFESVQVPVKE